VVVPLGAGTLLVALFVVRALRTAEPLVDLRLLRVRSFAASSVLMFAGGLTMFGGMFLLPLYYQQVRGAGVVTAGLLLAPQGLGALLARVSGSLADRLGPRPVVVAGLLLSALGTLPFVFTTGTANDVFLSLALVVRGLGMSAVILAVMVCAFQGLEPGDVPHASATVRILQQLGGSFGTAVLAVVVQRGLTHGTATAFGHAFGWTVVLTLLAVTVALMLPGRPLREQPGTAPDVQKTPMADRKHPL
jgi:MFS family permease